MGDSPEPDAYKAVWLPAMLRCRACLRISDGVIRRWHEPHTSCPHCGAWGLTIHDRAPGGARTLAEAEAFWKPS